MTPEQVTLLRAGLDHLRPDAIPAINLFYMRLFAIAPRVRDLFPDDMAAQNSKFADMLEAVAAMLDRPDTLDAEIAALGRRHARYGASAADYAVVEEALLWALGRHFGEAFSPEMRAAWTSFYRLLAAGMIRAAA